MSKKLEDVIAKRESTVHFPDGSKRRVCVVIRRPEPREGEGDYSCSFSITGLGVADETREILGYDSIQAIELALRFIGHIITGAVPVGSAWEDAQENMGFPKPPGT